MKKYITLAAIACLVLSACTGPAQQTSASQSTDTAAAVQTAQAADTSAAAQTAEAVQTTAQQTAAAETPAQQTVAADVEENDETDITDGEEIVPADDAETAPGGDADMADTALRTDFPDYFGYMTDKGFELYSTAADDGSRSYTLLEGGSEIKTPEQIKNSHYFSEEDMKVILSSYGKLGTDTVGMMETDSEGNAAAMDLFTVTKLCERLGLNAPEERGNYYCLVGKSATEESGQSRRIACLQSFDAPVEDGMIVFKDQPEVGLFDSKSYKFIASEYFTTPVVGLDYIKVGTQRGIDLLTYTNPDKTISLTVAAVPAEWEGSPFYICTLYVYLGNEMFLIGDLFPEVSRVQDVFLTEDYNIAVIDKDGGFEMFSIDADNRSAHSLAVG